MSTDDKSTSFFKLLAGCVPSEEYLQLVVSRALEYQRYSKSKHPSLKRLRTAINNSGLEIEGWRSKAAASAPTPRLVAPVSGLMPHSDDLAEAVFSVWADSHEPLRVVAADCLDIAGLPSSGPADDDGQIPAIWDPVMVDIEIGDVVNILYKDDIYLMLCCLSGFLPYQADDDAADDEEAKAEEVASIEGTVFAEWIKHLQSLPQEAPEWDRIKGFERSLSDIIQAKDTEHLRLEMIDIDIEEIKTRFSEELEYLERNIESWSAPRVPHSQVDPVFDLVGRLLESLEEYQPLRQQAARRGEEEARRAQRDELEPRLLRLIDDIDARMTGGEAPHFPDGLDDAPSPPADAAPEAPSTEAAPET